MMKNCKVWIWAEEEALKQSERARDWYGEGRSMNEKDDGKDYNSTLFYSYNNNYFLLLLLLF